MCQHRTAVDDALLIIDASVYIVPEFWNRFRYGDHRRPIHAKRWSGVRCAFNSKQPAEKVYIGTVSNSQRYIRISDSERVSVRGLRARLGRLYTGGWDVKKRHETYTRILKHLTIRFVIDADSQSIGVFFDGTGAFLDETYTNIFRDFLQYQGTRFYFPGVGNFRENTVYGIIAGAAWGDMHQQFLPSIHQAYEDLLTTSRDLPHKQFYLDIFGMSRGAAQAIELARMLNRKPLQNVHIRFLGLYEPVYSLGFLTPGHNSLLVKPGNMTGNWTQVTLPDNVLYTAVLYARHEDRTWFPATFFKYNRETTVLETGILTGAHGSICGPNVGNIFHRSLHLMSRSWMAQRARQCQVPRLNVDVLPPLFNRMSIRLTSLLANNLGWTYEDFGAGAIQGKQGINKIWIANKLMPWRWGLQTPLKNHYRREFSILDTPSYRGNTLPGHVPGKPHMTLATSQQAQFSHHFKPDMEPAFTPSSQKR